MATKAERVGSEVIDEYALSRIDHNVRYLGTQFGLSHDQREDYRQDMVVELLRAFHRFDPEKASRKTFINRVLGRFVKYVVRTSCARERQSCHTPVAFDDIWVGFEPPVNEARTGELDEQSRCELRLDMTAVIEQMPERVQRVCLELMKSDPSEAALSLGICRQSIHRNIKEIRTFLTEAGIKIPTKR